MLGGDRARENKVIALVICSGGDLHDGNGFTTYLTEPSIHCRLLFVAVQSKNETILLYGARMVNSTYSNLHSYVTPFVATFYSFLESHSLILFEMSSTSVNNVSDVPRTIPFGFIWDIL